MSLPVIAAHRLTARTEDRRWLVDGLWADQGVGIIGGEPKCCKSYLALDLAVAVASGAPCLQRFPVTRPGTVLLYAAEDAPEVVRERLDGICQAAGVGLETLDIQVIVAPRLRLDLQDDRVRLNETVERATPRLLILDPFVRLHGVDENNSGEVATILGFLRGLQKGHGTSIAVVHHAKKGARGRPGQALRGSSEFHAWGDSNLYLSRRGERLVLQAEHRAAPPVPKMNLDLVARPAGPVLRICDEMESESEAPGGLLTPEQRALDVLAEVDYPMTQRAIREVAGIRAASLSAALRELIEAGHVEKVTDGYRLAGGASRVSDSPSP